MKSKIFNIITWLIILGMLVAVLMFYKKNNFNDFIRSEMNVRTSEFVRDNEVKYSNNDSYEIISNSLNDAAFYKKIKLSKNTSYKVTCMIKTENVVPEKEESGIGAQISILDTTEKSIAVSGTSDWQKIELIFNSKNREDVDIGFRLGGYLGKCTGKAWFSDFSIEEGVANTSNNWKYACFIFENTDVNIDGKNVKLSMTNDDMVDIKKTIKRFETTMGSLSNNMASANCDVYNISKPVNKLTYDDEFGYYVAPEDVENSIKDVIKDSNYDHIFVIVRLGNEKYKDDIQINDWIGLRFYGLLWSWLFKY